MKVEKVLMSDKKVMAHRRLQLSMRTGGSLIVTLFLALLCSVQPASALQGNQGLQGGWAINDNGNLNFPHSLQNQLPLIRDAGAGWVRINFRLGNCYSNWTTTGCNSFTALQRYDTLVDDARARGLKVLGLLSNESWHGDQTQWVANNAENTSGNGDNAYLQAFSKQAAVVLTKYFQGRIDTWEVWNEPNAWTTNPSPGV
ncbi:MAG: endo-1,4-beta-xylanase, partial [Chloroflexi bacterium]|nr:endo-1,4-beta-xylanase [Chloroflexota bacterium]